MSSLQKRDRVGVSAFVQIEFPKLMVCLEASGISGEGRAKPLFRLIVLSCVPRENGGTRLLRFQD